MSGRFIPIHSPLIPFYELYKTHLISFVLLYSIIKLTFTVAVVTFHSEIHIVEVTIKQGFIISYPKLTAVSNVRHSVFVKYGSKKSPNYCFVLTPTILSSQLSFQRSQDEIFSHSESSMESCRIVDTTYEHDFGMEPIAEMKSDEMKRTRILNIPKVKGK